MLTTTDFDCRKNDLRLIVRLTVTARRNQELGHKATRHSTVIYFDNAVLTNAECDSCRQFGRMVSYQRHRTALKLLAYY